MVFDGTRALITGHYFGEPIGPWRHLVEPLGIEASSTLMKSIFVAYGWAWLFVVGAYVRRLHWAEKGMVVAAIASLWYIPFGTVISALQLLLLALSRRRRPA